MKDRDGRLFTRILAIFLIFLLAGEEQLVDLVDFWILEMLAQVEKSDASFFEPYS